MTVSEMLPNAEKQVKLENSRLYYKATGFDCSSENEFQIINTNLEFDWTQAGDLLHGLKSLKIPTFTKVLTIQPLRSKVLKSYDFDDMNPIQFTYFEDIKSFGSFNSFNALRYSSYQSPNTIFNLGNVCQDYLF